MESDRVCGPPKAITVMSPLYDVLTLEGRGLGTAAAGATTTAKTTANTTTTQVTDCILWEWGKMIIIHVGLAAWLPMLSQCTFSVQLCNAKGCALLQVLDVGGIKKTS